MRASRRPCVFASPHRSPGRNAIATLDAFRTMKMADVVHYFDWSSTPVGPIEGWPELLKFSVQMVLGASHPAAVWWGQGFIQIYNDAYAAKLWPGDVAKGLGVSAMDSWRTAWTDIGEAAQAAMQSGTTSYRTGHLACDSKATHAVAEWWAYSFSPIQPLGSDKPPFGVLFFCQDATEAHSKTEQLQKANRSLADEVKMRTAAEGRLQFNLLLGDTLRGLTLPEERARAALALLGSHMGVSRAYFTDIDEARNRFAMSFQWRRDGLDDLAGDTGAVDPFGPHVRSALREGRHIVVSDADADSETHFARGASFALGARACLVVPLLRGERLVAAVTLHHSEPHPWEPEDASMIQEVAERAWNAIEHARSYSRRIEAERALAESRAEEMKRLRAMFQQAPGFMCVLRGPDHVFEFANASYMSMVGKRELIGRPIREALPEVAGQGIYEALDEAYRSGMPIEAKDMPLSLRRGGQGEAESVHADFVLQPIRDDANVVQGIFVEGLDVTERRATKIALEAAKTRLQEGMVAARMAIWDWDLAKRKVSFSESSSQVFGGSWTKIDDVWNSIFPEDLARLNEARKVALLGSDSYAELIRIKRPTDEKILWLQVSARILRDDTGEATAIRGVSVDVTERKEAEERLRLADQRKDEFLAMLAHELRNPLAPISAGAEILKRMSTDPERVLRTAAVIERQARHMTAMVNDLLDVSRVTTGRVHLEMADIDLRSAIIDSLEQVRPMIEAKGQRIEYEPPKSAVCVHADKKRIVQIFTNLLQNAAKFTPSKGRVRVSIASMASQAIVVVEDDGMGIEPGLLPHVFELFTQERRSSDRTTGGLGLGLSLVRSLVEQHGGIVSAASDGPGKGATLTIAIPTASGETPKAERPVVPRVERRAASSLRILVVDDNQDAASSIATLLEQEGHRVIACHRSLEALEIVARADAEPFDAFVLDIGLLQVDGNELARKLRGNGSTAGARLIAVTGYSDPRHEAAAMNAGFDRFLVKPVEPSTLFEALAATRNR
jgi:PAS domain S-box-containing protein